jgi:uncharacterized protein (TIGR02996 family)
MNDDDAFLAAVRADPEDEAPRLIYADWLQERGDPRGQLIRVEEAMRQLPVFSDRYWQLKPLRNELRAQAPPGWLEAMRYGTDCEPIFRHGWPNGWKQKWRLVREFVERWHQTPMPDVGGWTENVPETEARLGRTLPPSVREWVAFTRDAQSCDVLRDGYQPLRELDGHRAISLLLQAEGDYHWAVRHADLRRADPPVYGFQLDYESEDESESTFVPDNVNPIADAVSSFAFHYALGYTSGEGGGFGTDVANPARLTRDLEATFPIRVRVGALEIYEAANIMVQVSRRNRQSYAYLRVTVARPTPREALPAFLWGHALGGGYFQGMFIQERHRR